MATYSSLLAWKIPWTEESGGLQSMGLQRFGMTGCLSIHKTHYSHYSFVSCLFPPIVLLCFFQYFWGADSLETYLRTAKITNQLTDLSANERWKKRSRFFPLCSIKKKIKSQQGLLELRKSTISMFLLPVMLGSVRLVGAWTRLFFDPANFQMMQTCLQLKMFFHCLQRGKMIIPAHNKVGILECHIYHWRIINQINYCSKNKTGPEIITGPYYYLFVSLFVFPHDFSLWYPTEYFLENKTTIKNKHWGYTLSLKILINIWEQFEMWSHESKRTERIFRKIKNVGPRYHLWIFLVIPGDQDRKSKILSEVLQTPHLHLQISYKGKTDILVANQISPLNSHCVCMLSHIGHGQLCATLWTVTW